MSLGGFQFGDRRYQELTTRPHRSEQRVQPRKGSDRASKKCETDCFQLGFWIPSGHWGGDLPPECRETKQAAVLLRAVGSWTMLCGSLAQVEVEIRGPGRCGGNLGICKQLRRYVM